MKTKILLFLLFSLLLAVALGSRADDGGDEGECLVCHEELTPGIYQQWKNSEHASHNVSCYDCHKADPKDSDAFDHEGTMIATIVSPRDCGRCHRKEAGEFIPSHHAKAGKILESNDAYLAHVVGGDPAAVAGCESCHGAKIVIDPDSPNRIAAGSWPNTGVGRINPDGSLGACNSCHSRHTFSREQVRQPETCGKCHLGPDHPQKEIYEESKHGITYFTNISHMNLDAERWLVGVDYFAAPTCATCHQSATGSQQITHDVGARISWTLRPAVSVLQKNWQKKRNRMMEVCSACHGSVYVDGHYRQFDGVVNLYNEKFARPAGEVMKILRKNGSLELPANMSNKVEWVYWELWHHEGRRARHGASMMGPDYTWWHGIYEVGQHFYFKFIPEVKKTGDAEAIAWLERLLADDPMHNWMSKNTDELKKSIQSGEIKKVYLKFYETEQKR